MSKSVKNKGKSKKGKKTSNPENDALEISKNQVKNLQGELNHALYVSELAKHRRLIAYNDRVKSAIALETAREDNKSHTAYLITEYEANATTLHERIKTLEKKIEELTETVEQKQLENNHLHDEFNKTLDEKNLKIKLLEQTINDQIALSQDAITKTCDKLATVLIEDFDKIYKEFKPFSIRTTDLYKLEFMRPPFLDEESTEYF